MSSCTVLGNAMACPMSKHNEAETCSVSSETQTKKNVNGQIDAAAFSLHNAPTLRKNGEILLFRWPFAQSCTCFRRCRHFRE